MQDLNKGGCAVLKKQLLEMKPCETVVLSNNQIVGLYPFISSLDGGDATRGNYESLSSDAPNIFRQPDMRKLF